MQVAAPPAPSRAAAHTDDAAALTEAAADDARTWLEGFRAARRQAAEYVESEGVEEEAEGENEADDRAAAVAAAAALLQQTRRTPNDAGAATTSRLMVEGRLLDVKGAVQGLVQRKRQQKQQQQQQQQQFTPYNTLAMGEAGTGGQQKEQWLLAEMAAARARGVSSPLSSSSASSSSSTSSSPPSPSFLWIDGLSLVDHNDQSSRMIEEEEEEEDVEPNSLPGWLGPGGEEAVVGVGGGKIGGDGGSNAYLLAALREEKEHARQQVQRIKELEHALVETKREGELALAAVQLESHELRCMLRRVAAESTFSDVFQLYEAHISRIERELHALRERNVHLELRRSLPSIPPPSSITPAQQQLSIEAAAVNDNLRRQARELQRQCQELRAENAELRKRERQATVQKRVVESTWQRVQKVQAMAKGMEGDLAASRLEAARTEARLEEAHQEIRALRLAGEQAMVEREKALVELRVLQQQQENMQQHPQQHQPLNGWR